MKIIIVVLIVMCGVILWTKMSAAQPAQNPGGKVQGIYDFTVKTIDGADKPLTDYKGKTLLIVNTASRCGFTPQYAPLEKLYETYKDKGLVVLGFPSNDFLGQEPGSNEEIKNFCTLKYKTTFPLFSKIHVNGPQADPLYVYLTTASGFNGAITWNFNKFLVSPEGKVVARFATKADPLSADVIKEVEKNLPR